MYFSEGYSGVTYIFILSFSHFYPHRSIERKLGRTSSKRNGFRERRGEEWRYDSSKIITLRSMMHTSFLTFN